MKNANTKGMGSKASKLRARLLTSWAAVIALAASILLTGCPQKPDPKAGKLTITVKGDENVSVVGPKTIEITKGSKWSEVKIEVEKKLIYKDGYEPASFKLDRVSGEDLKDDYTFNENKTVIVLSKIKGAANPAIFKTDGKGTITGYTCKKEELPKVLIIPEKIGDEVIKGIGFYAFGSCENITELKLPQTLIEIGVGAFEDCSNLSGIIVFPENLERLGEESYVDPSIFKNCTKLQGADFSACKKLKKILANAFKGCTSLTDLKLPQSLKSIGDEAFKDCPIENLTINCSTYTAMENLRNEASVRKNLKRVIIGEGVTTIVNYAFAQCTALTSINLPENLTLIGNSAFWNCTSLTSITLPESLTEIRPCAFYNCEELTGTIVFPASLKTITFGYGYKGVFENCTKLQGADFSACTELTKIPSIFFKNCTSLKELTLPKNIKRISSGAFENCPIEILNINCDITHDITEGLSKEASVKQNLKQLNIGEGITDIYYFGGCINLTNINFPKSLTKIGREAFKGCTGLTSLDFSGCTSLNKIDYLAFTGCKNLKELTLHENLEEIERGAFEGCPIETLTMNCNISKLTASWSSNLTSLKENLKNLNIGEGVTYINSDNYNGSSNIKGAFEDFEKLTNISLPQSLTSIGKEAFNNCTNLTNAVFADKEGWKVYDSDNSYAGNNISSSDLANAETAAEYLRQTYSNKYWKKN